MMRITSRRLILVPYTIELLQAEMRGTKLLADALGVAVPPSWPPPLNDEDSRNFFLGLLESGPPASQWGGWYVLLHENDELQLVGNAGYKGAPDRDGCVEIGYSVLPEYQRRGIASESVNALFAWAFATDSVRCVCAHTLMDDPTSAGVLLKCGFAQAGTSTEDGLEVLRFERREA